MSVLLNLTPACTLHRIHQRTALSGFAKLLDQDATPVTVSIVDISKGGISVLTRASMAAGAPCAITFNIAYGHAPMRVNVWGKVIYCLIHRGGGFRIGVRFKDSDAPSKEFIDGLPEDGDTR